MQVRPGGKSGTADVADDLSLLDAAAVFQPAAVLGHVRIQGAVFGAVLNDDGVAVTALLAAMHNLSVAGCLDRCAARGCVIDAFVRADLVQDGVFTPEVETGTDAREFNRRAQESLAHALAVQ